ACALGARAAYVPTLQLARRLERYPSRALPVARADLLNADNLGQTTPVHCHNLHSKMRTREQTNWSGRIFPRCDPHGDTGLPVVERAFSWISDQPYANRCSI